MLDLDFPLDVSCFREFYTDMTEDQMKGGPDGTPLDCVKFFRLHHSPRGTESVEISNDQVQLYTIEPDIEDLKGKGGELYQRLYESDRYKFLEHKVQDTVEKKVKPGPNKIFNYVLELMPFRNKDNSACGLNNLVAL